MYYKGPVGLNTSIRWDREQFHGHCNSTGHVLTGFRHLALEVWFLEPAVEFYRTHFDIETLSWGEREAIFDIGHGHRLVLREPGPLPRGGLHVHYALRIPSERYQQWMQQLSSLEPAEHEFGSTRSLYVYDEDGHCVELAGVADADGSYSLDGMFEVVLEVESLERARRFYTDLGFEVIDEGNGRERVRLDGPIALELWTPQRGIADARGGVHCELGFTAQDPAETISSVVERAQWSGGVPGGRRLQDPDGHYLTILTPETA